MYLKFIYIFKIFFLIKHSHLYRYESGFIIPIDIPFEDLSRADSDTSNRSQSNIPLGNMTIKGTISAHKKRQRTGIFSIFVSNKVKMI